MSSIQQYIDLYEANSSTINENSAPAVNALRAEALDALRNARLARKGDEDYETTNLDEMFAPDYGVNINRLKFEIDPTLAFRCDVPNMSTWLYFAFNDNYLPSRTANNAMPKGVIVGSLRTLAVERPDLVAKYYGKIAPLTDPQVALNTLLVQDGLFVYIEKNTDLEKPLQLVNILNTNMPFMANRRVLVVVGENAHAKMLVCDHTQNKNVDFLTSQVIEIYAEANSTFDFYDMEESSSLTHRVSSLWLNQSQGSNVLVNGITLVNGMTRNNYQLNVNGEHCETHLLGMTIAGDTQSVDNHTLIVHNCGHCYSNELFKYILEDSSVGTFSGKILVTPDSPKVESYQSNRNICLSPTAKMHSKPQLEIYTDDVKCGHGSTIGQLDQEALFYMQTRGISIEAARMLLMQAFMSDVIDGVRLDSLKDRLRHLVDKRLDGRLALCQECGNSCHEVLNK